MTVRLALFVACVAAACLGGGVLYAHGSAAPACDSDRTQAEVYRALHDQYHLDSVFLHNVKPMSGWYLSGSRACVAETAEIRGNIDAADLTWRQVHYRVLHSDTSDRPNVTVDLGGVTAFVPPPKQGFWAQWLVHF